MTIVRSNGVLCMIDDRMNAAIAPTGEAATSAISATPREDIRSITADCRASFDAKW